MIERQTETILGVVPTEIYLRRASTLNRLGMKLIGHALTGKNQEGLELSTQKRQRLLGFGLVIVAHSYELTLQGRIETPTILSTYALLGKAQSFFEKRGNNHHSDTISGCDQEDM